MRVDESIARGVNGLRDDFQKLYGIQEKLLRELAEAKREGGTATSSKGGGAPESKEEKGLNPFLAAAIVAATAMVTAVKDYFQNLTKLLKTLFKPVTSAIRFVFRQLSSTLRSIFRASKIGEYAADVGKSIRSVLTRMGNALKVLIPDPEAAQDAFKALKGYFTRVRTFFTTGGDDFIKFLTDNSIFRVLKNGFIGIRNLLFGSFQADEIKLVKEFIGNIGKRISGFFDPIRNFFSFAEDSPLGRIVARLKSVFSFASEGSGFVKMLGTIGRVIGRLAWPITLIMGVVDSVTGAFKGYVNTDGSIPEKLLMGLLGGISGLLEGLIGMPLDLLKGAVSWILGKFGFEEAEKMLDDFKFTDLIRDVIMSPFVMIKRGINAVIEAIAVGVDSIPFPGTSKVAQSIRDFKFEDTGESRTEMVARKKQEDTEAGEALDAYDAEQGLGKKKYTNKKLAQAAAGPGETVVQDDTGAYRIKKKAPQEIQAGQLKGKGAAFVGDDALAPVPTTGPSGAPIFINDNSSQVSGGGTLLAGESRASTGNAQALKTGFYRSSGGF